MTASFIFVLSAIPAAALLASLLVPHDPFGIAGWRLVVAIGAPVASSSSSSSAACRNRRAGSKSHGRMEEAEQSSPASKRPSSASSTRRCPHPIPTMPDVESDTGRWQEMFSAFYLPPHADHLHLPIRADDRRVRLHGLRAGAADASMAFPSSTRSNYSLMIVLLAPVGAACGTYFSERVERKWQLVLHRSAHRFRGRGVRNGKQRARDRLSPAA